MPSIVIDNEFSRETLTKHLAAIAAAGSKYTLCIGKALLAVLYFSVVEKDAKPANELVACLRKSTKQQAIIDLLQENGNLVFTKTDPANPAAKDKKVPQFFFYDAQQTWHPDDVKTLRETCANWEDYKGTPPVKEYDLLKVIEAALKVADSKATNKKPVTNAALAEFVKTAIASYSASKALKGVAVAA